MGLNGDLTGDLDEFKYQELNIYKNGRFFNYMKNHHK